MLIELLYPASLANLVDCPLTRVMQVTRIPEIKLLVDVIRLAFPFASIVLASNLGWGLEKGIALFSAPCMVGDRVHLLSVWYADGSTRQRD